MKGEKYMFGLGVTELLVILFIVVLLFGAKRLPLLGKSLGSSIKNFKKGLQDPDESKEEDSDKIA